MIIGEKNLILGKLFAIISEFSFTSINLYNNEKNFIIKKLKSFFEKIDISCNSPPLPNNN